MPAEQRMESDANNHHLGLASDTMTKFPEPITPLEIAQIAAEGVASALSARAVQAKGQAASSAIRLPWKIIIGLIFPKSALYEAELKDGASGIVVGDIVPHQPAPR